MAPAPLLTAPAIIQVHVVAAVGAMVLGAVQLAMPKGTPVHRTTGYIWAASMTVLAVSSFWIHTIRTIGPFSLIHLLSILTLLLLPRAIWAARRGNIVAHKRSMLALFVLALLGAGAFTLVPGRLMNSVAFGDSYYRQ